MRRTPFSLSIYLLTSWLAGSALAAEGPEALTAARTLWNKTAPTNYSYVVQTSSSVVTTCTQYQLVRISVRTGSIFRVVSLRKGEVDQELPDSCFQQFLTIDKLFDYIDLHQSGRDYRGHPCLKTVYDSKFGFPTDIEEECELDGDTPITVRDFRVTE